LREQVIRAIESLGIDFKALDPYEQRVLLEKISLILDRMDPPSNLEEALNAINTIYEFCGFPKVIALNVLYEVAKLCGESYPPVRNLVKEIAKRYKVIDRGCLEALYVALEGLRMQC